MLKQLVVFVKPRVPSSLIGVSSCFWGTDVVDEGKARSMGLRAAVLFLVIAKQVVLGIQVIAGNVDTVGPASIFGKPLHPLSQVTLDCFLNKLGQSIAVATVFLPGDETKNSSVCPFSAFVLGY